MKHVIDESEMHERYKSEIFDVMENEPYARFLGIKLVKISEGKAVAKLNVKDYMLNSHGTVHGAIIFAIADYVLLLPATLMVKQL